MSTRAELEVAFEIGDRADISPQRAAEASAVSTREEFEMAFQIITDGDRADISAEWKRRLFGEHWPRMMRAHQDEANEWINTTAVQGLGVGNRTSEGRPTDELAIVVYVDRKRPRKKVRTPVPRQIVIPGLGKFETDVVAIGRLKPHPFAERVRPAMPGCSIGHRDLEGVRHLRSARQEAGSRRARTVHIEQFTCLGIGWAGGDGRRRHTARARRLRWCQRHDREARRLGAIRLHDPRLAQSRRCRDRSCRPRSAATLRTACARSTSFPLRRASKSPRGCPCTRWVEPPTVRRATSSIRTPTLRARH